MSEEVLSSEQLKQKFKDKVNNLYHRLNQVLDNLDISNNSNNFCNIFDLLEKIDEKILDLENKLDENKINNIDERNRIIDQKIFKLFSPFIFYYKLSLMNNL